MSTRQTRASAARAASLLASHQQRDHAQQLSSPSTIPALATASGKVDPKKPSALKSIVSKSSGTASSKVISPTVPANTGGKRKRTTVPKVDDSDELPHGLGKSLSAMRDQFEDEESDVEGPPLKKRLPSSAAAKVISKSRADAVIASVKAKASPTKSPKKNNYGHTPGKSPFPGWNHPTPEEVQVIHDALTEKHGLHAPPETIPAPSSTYAGCGEVPSILDALIRTYLSSNTHNKNSSVAIQGIMKTFSHLKEGTGKGSPDYNEIRLADASVLKEAINGGGQQNVKTKYIKQILDMVYEENEAHRKAYKKRKETDNTDAVETDDGTITVEKSAELTCANPDVLTLDHLHALSDLDAFNRLIAYPGIGLKTAACVLLFCMKRQTHSFAVDTHVHRILTWLGWIPEHTNENKAFTHCEATIPNELKYGLHQLFVKHGRTCGRCASNRHEGMARWDEGCVIDHLVDRLKEYKPAKKIALKTGKKAPLKKRKKLAEDDDEAIESAEGEN